MAGETQVFGEGGFGPRRERCTQRAVEGIAGAGGVDGFGRRGGHAIVGGRIAARVPVAAVTNGNADLERVGIAHLFAFSLGSREHGAAKPQASIFLAACARLGHAPGEVLHVGDHVEADVAGAARAGLRSCWIRRGDNTGGHAAWPLDDVRSDLEFESLAGLADWLDARG